MAWIPIAMIAADLIKNQQDQAMANKQRQLAASTQQYSPWTGLQAQKVTDPNWAGGVMQAGASGLAGMQSYQNNNAMQDYLKNGGSPKVNFNVNSGSPSSAAGSTGSYDNALGDYKY